jgi:hypothetical protein
MLKKFLVQRVLRKSFVLFYEYLKKYGSVNDGKRIHFSMDGKVITFITHTRLKRERESEPFSQPAMKI